MSAIIGTICDFLGLTQKPSVIDYGNSWDDVVSGYDFQNENESEFTIITNHRNDNLITCTNVRI